jgi:DNA-binding phage protein
LQQQNVILPEEKIMTAISTFEELKACLAAIGDAGGGIDITSTAAAAGMSYSGVYKVFCNPPSLRERGDDIKASTLIRVLDAAGYQLSIEPKPKRRRKKT